MTKTNKDLSNSESPENFISERENYAFSENYTSCPSTRPAKSRRWAYTKLDLTKICFICDDTLKVKYVLPKKQYSQKNLWGHWTQNPPTSTNISVILV